MDLLTTANLLTKGDNKTYFVKVYRHYKKEDKVDLKKYLEYIDLNIHDWFYNLPNDIQARATFSKPKTAILNVLKHPVVIQAIGEKYCESFKNRFLSFYKEKGDDIFIKRTTIISSNKTLVTLGGTQEQEPIITELSSDEERSQHSDSSDDDDEDREEEEVEVLKAKINKLLEENKALIHDNKTFCEFNKTLFRENKAIYKENRLLMRENKTMKTLVEIYIARKL